MALIPEQGDETEGGKVFVHSAIVSQAGKGYIVSYVTIIL